MYSMNIIDIYNIKLYKYSCTELKFYTNYILILQYICKCTFLRFLKVTIKLCNEHRVRRKAPEETRITLPVIGHILQLDLFKFMDLSSNTVPMEIQPCRRAQSFYLKI